MSDIVIAPFSNSDIRDWPLEHFAALIGILLERWESRGAIKVVGTRSQRLRGNEVVRAYPPGRVVNSCGGQTWPELVEDIKAAACVVGNNSGVTHMSGFLGVPTVCVFGGSHQRLEWRPRGFSVTVVTRSIGCSPCQLDHGRESPYAKACLRQIEPELVAETVLETIARVQARGAPPSAAAPKLDRGVGRVEGVV
jgi:ADP-heptose:LPS heptosyltransferase